MKTKITFQKGELTKFAKAISKDETREVLTSFGHAHDLFVATNGRILLGYELAGGASRDTYLAADLKGAVSIEAADSATGTLLTVRDKTGTGTTLHPTGSTFPNARQAAPANEGTPLTFTDMSTLESVLDAVKASTEVVLRVDPEGLGDLRINNWTDFSSAEFQVVNWIKGGGFAFAINARFLFDAWKWLIACGNQLPSWKMVDGGSPLHHQHAGQVAVIMPMRPEKGGLK